MLGVWFSEERAGLLGQQAEGPPGPTGSAEAGLRQGALIFFLKVKKVGLGLWRV